MAGESDTHIQNLAIGKGQGLLMSPTQGQAYIIGGNPIPAISRCLKARLYGWLPLSDAAGIGYSGKRGFVKEYSNFDPKKQGVLVTKVSLGRKNGDFCGFW